MAEAIDSSSKLDTYFTSQGLVASNSHPLTGGSVNYIWRVDVDAEASSKSREQWVRAYLHSYAPNLIIKHAEPFVAVNPGIPFPQDRMIFEANALRSIPPLMGDSTAELQIHLPTLYHLQETSYMLSMSDSGSKNLKDAYADLKTSQVRDMGARLGSWLAALHFKTRSLEMANNGNATAKWIYRHAYNNLAAALKHNGLDEELGKTVNEIYGAKLATDDGCICQGDFWPANVIVADSTATLAGHGAIIPCTVIDWEMTRRGCGATDVGQFTAEAYLLDCFRGQNHQLASTFLRRYLAAAEDLGQPPSKEFIGRVAVHCGTHLAFWPGRVSWTDTEGTRKLAETGVELIRRGMAGDESWIHILERDTPSS